MDVGFKFTDVGVAIFGGLFAILMVALYFLPAIIAGRTQHKHGFPIFMLNLLTGWTFFGWVGALIWSLVR